MAGDQRVPSAWMRRALAPQPGPQQPFLRSAADIAIYGGAAGGGKTWALLLEAVRHQAVHDFTAVLFRRNYPQLTAPGGMWDESAKLLPLLGTTPNRSTLAWQFPSGACVKSTKRSLNS